MRTSISGSTSRTASQVVGTDRSPSRPRRSQPPARRICSGTQWPTANGGSSHSRPTTRTGGCPRSRRSARCVSSVLSRSRRLGDHVDRGVLGVGHRADRRDRVEDALDRRRLERHDADVGVDRPGHLVDLAVADRADRAQLLGQDEVRVGRLERLLVELVERRAAVDRLADEAIDLTRRALGQVVGRAGDRRDRCGLGRPVALVGHPDELVAEPEGEDDLGRRRQERDDPHRASLARAPGGTGASRPARRAIRRA